MNTKRVPFNERTRNMTLTISPNQKYCGFPGDGKLHIEFIWENGKVKEAEIRNDEFDFIGLWLGKIEVIQ